MEQDILINNNKLKLLIKLRLNVVRYQNDSVQRGDAGASDRRRRGWGSEKVEEVVDRRIDGSNVK